LAGKDIFNVVPEGTLSKKVSAQVRQGKEEKALGHDKDQGVLDEAADDDCPQDPEDPYFIRDRGLCDPAQFSAQGFFSVCCDHCRLSDVV